VDGVHGAVPGQWQTGGVARRFIPLTEVSEILDISAAQAYALVRSGDLPAIKVGGRGQWRVETTELESYIQRMYAETRDVVATRGERDTGGPVPEA
jgi:excisionase family DNA binding protein